MALSLSSGICVILIWSGEGILMPELLSHFKDKEGNYTQDIISVRLHGKYACNARFWLVDCRSRCPHTCHTQLLTSLQPLKRYNNVYIPWLMSRNKWIKEANEYQSVINTILAKVKTQPVINPNIFVVILLHEKFLWVDWLGAVVFQLNLKYLHVKITNLFEGSSINK